MLYYIIYIILYYITYYIILDYIIQGLPFENHWWVTKCSQAIARLKWQALIILNLFTTDEVELFLKFWYSSVFKKLLERARQN